MQFLRQFIEQLKQVWRGMSLPRRVAMVVLTAACVAAIIGVGIWAAQPDYRTLYSGLSAEDAGAITAKLQTQGVSFHLSAGGTSILVPAEQVQQLRLDLAVEGMPSKGGKGFELFDEAPLGMTPFMQQVNYGRALQAELAKTIMQLEPVAQARVHIVRPDPTPFVREQKPTTASVMLKLKPGATLNRSMSAGIVALVSRSVEGLTPDQVTLVDTNGHILSDQHGSEVGATASSQLDYRRELETYLASKAEDMLAQLLGQGRAVVRVTADVNFKTVKEKKETYSPEDRVITSEKVTNHKSTNASPAALGPAGTASNLKKPPATPTASGNNSQEETIQTDYMVSKSVQELEDRVGNIERLTIAAMIDLSKEDKAASGQPARTITLAEAQDIIKEAVGYKQGRDEIKVTDVKLAAPDSQNSMDAEYVQMQRWQTYMGLARQASLGVAALVVLVLGFLVLRRFRPAAPPANVASSPEETRVMEQLSAVAEKDPEVLARLLTTWLEKPEASRKAAA